jgi:hypothetical protein
MYRSFGEFVDKKKRDAFRQLRLIEKLLVTKGFKVENFLNEDSEDPYVFCFNPVKNTSFDGIRIYKIGNILAFRIQKESETHPYGNAYQMKIEEMFDDLMSEEGIDEKEAGKRVIEAIAHEIRRFFEKSEEAEQEERSGACGSPYGDDNKLDVRSTPCDYSSQIYSKA